MAQRVPQVTIEVGNQPTSQRIRVPQVTIEVGNQPTLQQIRVAQVTVESAILPGPLTGNCGNPPQAFAGKPYTTTLVVQGGWPPYTFAITSGSLPPGLSLDPTTGVISGFPTPPVGGCLSIIHFDDATHNDTGIPFNSFWKSGLMRDREIATKMIRVGSCDIWVRGQGTLDITVASMDNTIVLNPPLLLQQGNPVQLSPSPGWIGQTKFDLAGIENYTVQVGTNGIDQWWELSGLMAYQKPQRTNR